MTLKNSQTKLTPEQVLQIKELLLNGCNHKDIADMFNISRSVITRISNGKRWSNITGGPILPAVYKDGVRVLSDSHKAKIGKGRKGKKQKTSLISIPRDLYYEGRKINEYYKFYGIEKTIKVIQKISGIKADKYIRFNFDSFTDLIDSIEGIDISIDQKLIDNSYPNGNLGYKTVVFNPGLEKMNGQRALEYARSRKISKDAASASGDRS
jgi:LCP family protein required for cell wall assembly